MEFKRGKEMRLKDIVLISALLTLVFLWTAGGGKWKNFSFPVYAEEGLSLTLATGRQGGTYYAVGNSMASVLLKKNIDLSVMESEGSYQNIIDLSSGTVDIALAQMDVLAYLSNLSDEGNKEAKQVLENVFVLFPLFMEQVHIVVRDEMKFGTLRDFKGKRIEVGELNSGSYISSQVILHAMQLSQVAHFMPKHSPPEDAYRAVRESRSDVMFYMAGAPAGLFAKKVSGPVSFKTKFVSLSLVDLKALDSLYQTVTIPAGAYPGQPQTIKTVGTWAVLLATQNVSRENGYALVKTIVESLPLLKKSHKKWGEVSPDAVGKAMKVKGLQAHPGLLKWLDETKTVKTN